MGGVRDDFLKQVMKEPKKGKQVIRRLSVCVCVGGVICTDKSLKKKKGDNTLPAGE